jgi:hypothetical protein
MPNISAKSYNESELSKLLMNVTCLWKLDETYNFKLLKCL